MFPAGGIGFHSHRRSGFFVFSLCFDISWVGKGFRRWRLSMLCAAGLWFREAMAYSASLSPALILGFFGSLSIYESVSQSLLGLSIWNCAAWWYVSDGGLIVGVLIYGDFVDRVVFFRWLWMRSWDSLDDALHWKESRRKVGWGGLRLRFVPAKLLFVSSFPAMSRRLGRVAVIRWHVGVHSLLWDAWRKVKWSV